MIRSDVIVPETMPEEHLVIACLGGDGAVIVRGLWLAQLRAITAAHTSGEDQTFGMLAQSVLGTDGQPVMLPDEWQRFASVFRKAFNEILDAARRVNGLDRDDVKND